MNSKQINKFFARLQAQNPNPQTELNYSSNFELLVSVILSAQATDKSVNKATMPLFKVAKSAADFLSLGEDGLRAYIKTIGLYNNKARNIIKTCAILVEKYDGKVPNQRVQLEALPGVGRKTANVILNTAFGEATIAVDTHIFRLSNRSGLAAGKNVVEVEKNLLANIAKKYQQNAHHWLILHGRYTCTARKPKCDQCVVADLCEYEKV
ncbi:endonuclease III [Candidatus Marithrix sp. Canyon 246]|uniref:endonuclease III n=1 Tax=Candidatus Marithrix sp. Canyon 246 TaxID=1827136 RepID=UPI000A95A8D0|nr:endonuclease III [Candidatus Marithrix sp. Canyon 246]